jgi:hypothetical protein
LNPAFLPANFAAETKDGAALSSPFSNAAAFANTLWPGRAVLATRIGVAATLSISLASLASHSFLAMALATAVVAPVTVAVAPEAAR